SSCTSLPSSLDKEEPGIRLARSDTTTLRRLLEISLAPGANCASVPSTPLSNFGVAEHTLLESPAGRLVTAAGSDFSAGAGAKIDPAPTTAPAASTAAKLSRTAPVFLRVGAEAASLDAAARALSSLRRRWETFPSAGSAALGSAAAAGAATALVLAASSLAALRARTFSSFWRRLAALGSSASAAFGASSDLDSADGFGSV